MSDIKSRALRTAAQNLLFDIVLAVVVVVLPAFQGDLSAVNWGLLISSLVKTVAVTTLSAVQRYVESVRQERPSHAE